MCNRHTRTPKTPLPFPASASWILAQLPGHIRVAGDDITEKYLLLSNSHDDKSSVTIKFTPVRVVCQNTLTLALNDGSAWRVSHHSDIQQKLQQAHEMMGLITERFDDLGQMFQAMSRVQLNQDRLGEYLAAVYPDSPEPDKQLLVQRDRSWSEFFFDQGKGNRLAGVEAPCGPGSTVSPNGSITARPGRTPINGSTRPGLANRRASSPGRSAWPWTK
ncbi:MAG: DUF932 domain-containing protein [Verrucomicrobiota bacterium]